MSILQVTVETVSGKEHEFFFNGDLQELNDVLGVGPAPCCDSLGNAIKRTKSFIASNISAVTIDEVEPSPPQSKTPYLGIPMTGDDGEMFTMYVEQ